MPVQREPSRRRSLPTIKRRVRASRHCSRHSARHPLGCFCRQFQSRFLVHFLIFGLDLVPIFSLFFRVPKYHLSVCVVVSVQFGECCLCCLARRSDHLPSSRAGSSSSPAIIIINGGDHKRGYCNHGECVRVAGKERNLKWISQFYVSEK